MIGIAAILMFAGAFVLGAWDGVKRDYGFLQFFGRFLAMLYLMEIYDICFFDWYLLCHSNFFPHFYPELKGVVGPQQFGYNKRRISCILFSTSPPVPCWHGCVRSCDCNCKKERFYDEAGNHRCHAGGD